MSKQTRRRRLFFICGLAIALVAWSLSKLLSNGNDGASSLTISAGDADGLRHAIAESLAELTASRRLELDVVPTAGSSDALEQVNAGELDLALVQGGLANSSYKNVRQAAVLHVEPLHLLAKPDLAAAANANAGALTIAGISRGLNNTRQRTVCLGLPGSGTNALASELVRFFGLKAGEDFIEQNVSYHELLNTATTEKLPDVVFTLSSMPSPVVKHLITVHGYRPVELPVSNAFRIDWSRMIRNDASGLRVVRRRLTTATIPAYVYQTAPPVPDRPIQTLGTRLQLVAHRDASAEAVERLIDVIYASALASAADPPLSVELLQTSAEFELHAGAASYLNKKAPMINEHLVDLTEKLVAICGAVCGAILFIWQAMLFSRRKRRDRQFLACIERVSEIEHRAMKYESDDHMTIFDLIGLQNELTQIKTDMVQQFQSGDIDGADTLSGFLMHVNDANENLTRMILHERDARVV